MAGSGLHYFPPLVIDQLAACTLKGGGCNLGLRYRLLQQWAAACVVEELIRHLVHRVLPPPCI